MSQGFQITWGGINDFFTATFNNSNGITPGRVALTLPPQRAESIKLFDTLRIENTQTETEIKIYNAIVDRGSYSYNTGGEVVSLVILDGRWQWEFQHISGNYNIKNNDGEITVIEDSDGNVPENDAIANSEKTLHELMVLLLDEMTDNNSSLYSIHKEAKLDDLTPTVYWDFSNPAYELQLLCNQVNYAICYDHENGHIYVEPNGQENFRKTEKNILGNGKTISLGETVDPVNPTKKIGILPNVTKFQIDLELEAVGLYRGDFYKLDDLPYQPDDGIWKIGHKWDWVFEASGTSINDQRDAQNSLFKIFRIKVPEQINTGGDDWYDLPEITRREQLLPLFLDQVDTETIDGKTEIARLQFGVALQLTKLELTTTVVT